MKVPDGSLLIVVIKTFTPPYKAFRSCRPLLLSSLHVAKKNEERAISCFGLSAIVEGIKTNFNGEQGVDEGFDLLIFHAPGVYCRH